MLILPVALGCDDSKHSLTRLASTATAAAHCASPSRASAAASANGEDSASFVETPCALHGPQEKDRVRTAVRNSRSNSQNVHAGVRQGWWACGVVLWFTARTRTVKCNSGRDGCGAATVPGPSRKLHLEGSSTLQAPGGVLHCAVPLHVYVVVHVRLAVERLHVCSRCPP